MKSPQDPAQSANASVRMPNLDSQPLWIKVAAMSVAVGGIIALIALYIVRL
ncbi:MAG: hypothetical protein ACI9R3_005100 [Verrucomicrobiales bacterium]|jgi:hypothetical protein